MTQSNENAAAEATSTAKPQATNIPFNLIITHTRDNAKQIAKHYALDDVRFVDDIQHLPDGGAARGKALNALLAKHEHTLTLVLLLDDVWVKSLLTDHPSMAASVWRGVEGKLFGFNTEKQRNLLIVALDVNNDVRRAEDNLQLRKIEAGRRLSQVWRPVRVAAEKPVAAPKAPQPKAPIVKTQAKRNEPAQGKPDNKKQNASKDRPASQYGLTDGKGNLVTKPQGKKQGKLDRSKKHTGPGGEFSSKDNTLTNDLYLLCRGHYGANTPQVLIEKAKRLIADRTNQKDVSTNQVARLLFVTLSRLSSRSYWKSYNVLQSLINAGSESPAQLANTLAGHISSSPIYDENSMEIPQPTVNPTVTKLLDERYVEEAAVEATPAAVEVQAEAITA